MKQLWTKLSFAALLLCVLIGLGGCHGSKALPEFTVPEDFDTASHYEITFWAKNDTNKTQTEIYKKAIKDFESMYPNIAVTLRLYTDYGKIYNDVITNIATHTTPNVCITYPDHIATYLTGQNTVVPLEQLFQDEDYGLGGQKIKYASTTQDAIIPDFLEECNFGEHYYAVPFMRSTEACYVNKTYVEALGYELPDILTWDFIWEVSEAATAKNTDGSFKLNQQKIMLPFIYKSTDNMMIQMLRQSNAGYSTEDGDIDLFNDTTTKFLYTISEHVKSGAFSTFKVSGYPANFLNAGQCIFAVDSTAGATWMGTNAPLSDISADSLVQFETAVRPVPQLDPNHLQMISQGPSVCIFNKANSQEVLASWLFVQYLLTNDVQIAYAQTEGYVPVTSKAQTAEAYLDYLNREGEDNSLYYDVKLKASKLLMAHTNDTFVTPVFNGSASLRDASGQLVEGVVKSTKRKETINQAYMDKLFENTNALCHLSQTGKTTSGKRDLGPLPVPSIVLLGCLVIVWILIIICVLCRVRKSKKKN